MIKTIPIDHEDALEICRLQHEFNAYYNIVKRLKNLNLSVDLKSTYKLKFVDAKMKLDIFSLNFNQKYLDANFRGGYKIDIVNDIIIYNNDKKC